MENNEPILEQEKEPKVYKKHPTLALFCAFFAAILIIIACCVFNIDKFDKVYTCLYIVASVLLLLSYNTFLDFKPIIFIFYPILTIYTLISAFGFSDDLIAFQFSIIACIINLLFAVQLLIDFIRFKKIDDIIACIVLTAITIILTSIHFIAPTIIDIILCASFILIIGYRIYKLFINKNKELTIEDKQQ